MKNIKTMLSVAAVVTMFHCAAASAQTSWCSEAIRIEAPMIPYPPIARAAHVSGAVIGRLFLSVDGTVQKFDLVSGPAMLTTTVDTQVKKWKFKQQQSVPRVCQALIIVEFSLDSEENPDTTPPPSNGIKVFIKSSRPFIQPNYSKSAE